MNHTLFGYVRVSSKDQNEARQVKQMLEQGIPERNIFKDKVSGDTFVRNKYLALLEVLRQGDTLFISSIDRLGRNYQEILDQWRYLVSHLQVDIVVLDMPILDTRSELNLTSRLISDIVLQLLSYVAHNEREQIRKRQQEGIAIAKSKGVSFGRPELMFNLQQFVYWQNKIEQGLAVHTDAQRDLGLKHSTYYNILKEYRNNSGRFSTG